MASSDVKVLGAKPSPFVARARIALNLKGVPFEFLEEKFGAKSELLLKSNPVHKKIPVLIHHDKPVCESLVIVQYVDEAWSTTGVPILPSDPYDRAIARFWAAFVDDKVFVSMGGIRKAQGEIEKAAAIQELKENIHLLEDAFVSTSKGKPFFSGEDHIGYLDIAFGSLLGWIGVTERFTGIKIFDKNTPNLAQWTGRFLSDPAVKEVIPPIEEMMVFAKIIAEKQAAAAAAAAAGK